MYMSTQNGFSLATCLIEAESRNTYHFPSLRLGLTASQPSRRHHAQSLLHPSFHDLRTPHVLESHPKRAAPLSRRDDEWRHAVGSHSILHLYLADCIATPPQVMFLRCSNLSVSFDLCWITETRSLILCACFTFSSSAFAFLIETNFSFQSCLQFGRYHHSDSTSTLTSA